MEGVDAQGVPVVAAAEARVTVLGDVVLGDAEDLAYLDAGPDRPARPVVRLLEDREKTFGGGHYLTVNERSAAVAAVAAYGGAAVEFYEVALLQARVALRVNPDTDSSTNGRQDPVVGVLLIAGICHRRPRHAHHVAVAHVRRRHAGAQVLDREAHPRLRELRRPPQPFDLGRVLDAPQRVHVVGEVHPLRPRGHGGEPTVGVEKHVAQVGPYPRPEQPPVAEQSAQNPVLLALVVLGGSRSFCLPASERGPYRLRVPDLRPQTVGAHVPYARHPPGWPGLEVPDHHPDF